jgi:hypothetical protein
MDIGMDIIVVEMVITPIIISTVMTTTLIITDTEIIVSVVHQKLADFTQSLISQENTFKPCNGGPGGGRHSTGRTLTCAYTPVTASAVSPSSSS